GIRYVHVTGVQTCALPISQAPLVYVIRKRIGGRVAGILAALLLVYFDPMIRQGSQLLPEVFSATYALGALYLYVRATEAHGRRRARNSVVEGKSGAPQRRK